MNNTRFFDGRLGIGRTPIFPLDVSGNTRIEGDLVLKGTIADANGVPIYFGHAGVTSTDGSNNNYHIGINKAAATDANFPLDVEGNININNGSLFINGNVAEFSNWTDIGETEEEGIYRNSKVAIGKTTANHMLDVSGTVNIAGDILLNGTTMEPNPSVPALQAYTDTGPTWKDETIVTTVASSSDTTQALTTALNDKADKASPEFSGNVGIGKAGNASYALDILGDVNITSGALKLNGSTPVYSNWIVSGDDIYRDSKVTIGTTTVQNYQLYVNGNTHVQGTLSATTLDGNLEWSKIQNAPTTIVTSQSNAIVANTAKVSSQWVTGSSSKIYYNSGNVGIGTTSPTLARLQINSTSICGIYLMGDYTDYNYILNAPPPGYTTGGAVHFINSTTRTADGGATCYTLRNDSGPIRLGKGNYVTTIEGSDVILDGNVGIGTTSPGAPLEIKCITGNTNAQWDGAKGLRLARNRDDYAWEMVNGYHNDLLFRNMKPDGTIYKDNVLMLDDNGNVGIGTSSPSTLLQIKGNGDSNNVQLLIENEGYNKGIQFQYKSVSGTSYNFPQAKIWTSGSSYDTKLYFSTAKGSSNSNTVLSTVMTLDDGNVGIGTTSPNEKLNVNDSSSSATGIIYPLKINNQAMHTSANQGGGVGIRFGLYDNAMTDHRYSQIAGISEDIFSKGTAIAFYTNSSVSTPPPEVMRINEYGNVGIGTTAPESKLDILDNAVEIEVTLYNSTNASAYTHSQTNPYSIDSITINNTGDGWTYYINNKNPITSGEYIMQFTYYSSHNCTFVYNGDGAFETGSITLDSKPTPIRTFSQTFTFTSSLTEIRLYIKKNNGYILYIEDVIIYPSNRPVLKVNKNAMTVSSNGNIKTTGFFKYENAKGGLVGDYPRRQIGHDLYPIFCLNEAYIGTDGTAIPKYSVGYCYPPQCDVPGTTNHSWGMYIDGTKGGSPDWAPYANWFLSGTKNKWSYMQSGRLGIGITEPAATLQVNGNILIGSVTNEASGADHTDAQLILGGGINTSAGYNENGQVKLLIANMNNDGVVNYAIYIEDENEIDVLYCNGPTNGNGSGSVLWFKGEITGGDITDRSDDRLKHNEKPVLNALETINKLKAKTYFKSLYLKDETFDYELDNSGNPITEDAYHIETGFIAQEIMKIDELKHAVRGGEWKPDPHDPSHNRMFETAYSLSYKNIFTLNVAATQELDKKVIALEAENAELKAKIQSIEQRLAYAGF